jgi:hypothetical protein
VDAAAPLDDEGYEDALAGGEACVVGLERVVVLLLAPLAAVTVVVLVVLLLVVVLLVVVLLVVVLLVVVLLFVVLVVVVLVLVVLLVLVVVLLVLDGDLHHNLVANFPSVHLPALGLGPSPRPLAARSQHSRRRRPRRPSGPCLRRRPGRLRRRPGRPCSRASSGLYRPCRRGLQWPLQTLSEGPPVAFTDLVGGAS